jgi:arylsulfatase A-like enzyme
MVQESLSQALVAPTAKSSAVPRPIALAPRTALWLAITAGVLGGLLDIAGIALKRRYLDEILYVRQGRDFVWSVPLVTGAVLLLPGLLVAAANRVRTGLVPMRIAVWLFVSLAFASALSRQPLATWAIVLIAAGLGRLISRWVCADGGARLARVSGPIGLALGFVVAAMATATSGREAWREYTRVRNLETAPPGARNVILIVMDTVRADSLSLYGYARPTTPALKRWAGRGVTFQWALAPAPWTFPSHSCLFTGEWPSRTNGLLKHLLDWPAPTLAEFLSAQGYQTAGFVGNTLFCSYEGRFNRGFVHYEDYPVTPVSLLGRVPVGRWLLEHTLGRTDPAQRKWIRIESRDARDVNRSFLDWLSRRRIDRPFFAFLNYFDAHDPFLVPRTTPAHFGVRPQSDRDVQFLLSYWDVDKRSLSAHDAALAHDSYEDCIAFVDEQVGRLLDALERRGLLRDTVVVVTSDHGESFGEHGVYQHSMSLKLPETHVPLLIIAPDVPAGRTIAEPVSLRDLPATLLDLAGVGRPAPFRGHSLATCWDQSSPNSSSHSPALSELYNPIKLDPRFVVGRTQMGYAVSMVADGRHFIRDSAGTQELFDLRIDPAETTTLNLPMVARAFLESIYRILATDRTGREEDPAYRKRFVRTLDALLNGTGAPSRRGPQRGVPVDRTAPIGRIVPPQGNAPGDRADQTNLNP